MPDYKKKRVNRLKNPAKRQNKEHREKETKTEKIPMQKTASRRKAVGKSSGESTSQMRVVKGKKLEVRRRVKIFSYIAVIIAAAAVILHICLPGGLIENAAIFTSLIGKGSYPADLESDETLDVVSRGSYYYVLTDTHISAYSNSGKKLFSYAHGYENPIIKTSKTRAVVFNQGGNEAVVYSLNGQKAQVKTEKGIITAAVSDSGAYAVAARSDNYAATVSVYNKRGAKVYEWYSAESLVNNIIISPNGKKIAVSVFDAPSGQFNAKISVLNFKSATPEFSESINDSTVYNLDSFHNSGFFAVTSAGVRFYTWKDYKKSEYTNEYAISQFRTGTGGAVAVFNRESDRTDNRIAVLTPKGQLKNEFEFKGVISDIQIYGGHIYCISDTNVYLLGEKGKILYSAECGFGAVRHAVIGNNQVAVVTDNKIEKYKLEQE